MKQNVLKTLAFTIAIVCVGSLYGQTKTFQRITSISDLTDGNYIIVGHATVSNTVFYYAMGKIYTFKSSNYNYTARRAIPLTGWGSSRTMSCI